MNFEILDDYARFTESMWTSKARAALDGAVLDEADYTVMSLGLAGEFGEMLEVLAGRFSPEGLDQSNFTKEMGDTWYYWARICSAFRLVPSEILREHGIRAKDVAWMGSDTVLARAICQAGAAVGRVSELMKKRTRDDVLPMDQLEAALAKTAGELLALSGYLAVSPVKVLEHNRSKLADRQNRGVLQGSGDNR